jgi:hypothetical protein
MLPAIVTRGQSTEEHAALVLAEEAGRDPAVMRDAAIRLQQDPDVVPLSVTRQTRCLENPRVETRRRSILSTVEGYDALMHIRCTPASFGKSRMADV